ncbi:MAG: ATP synthase F0 subunit B [Elusimicrobiota bacterium]|jgi:F-type H+-transporting ATPase subunit b|nr:ATP synthase F0 subunit B [Elusimicrobiota bacterium]
MEILHTFGLETELFLFQIINFLIIAGILAKFLYKPLKNMLEERKRKIAQSLVDADNAKEILENAGQEKKKILSKAKKDADELAAVIKVQIANEKQKAEEQAKERAQQIINDANVRAEVELENVSRQAGKMSVDLSEKILSKVFDQFFTPQDKQQILSRALDALAKGNYEKGSN